MTQFENHRPNPEESGGIVHLVTFGVIYEMLQDDPDPMRFSFRTVSSEEGTFVELLKDGGFLERTLLPVNVDPSTHAIQRLRKTP